MSEPTAGWVDNFNGPVGLMIPIGIGFSRILLGNKECPLNFVPVDYISNSLIAIIAQSAEVLEEKKSQGVTVDEVPIFNYGVDKRTAIKITDIMRHGMEVCTNYPMSNMVWYPGTGITPSVLIYSIFFYIRQLLPGLVAELLLRTLKYKFSVLRILRKIYYVQVSLLYFMTKEFDFRNRNTVHAFKSLSAADQEMFPCAADLDFTPYMTASVLGAQKYLMHQDPKTQPRDRIRFRIMQGLHYALMAWCGVYVLQRVLRVATVMADE